MRHPDTSVLQRLADADVIPVINAMTDVNHPCEVLSDLYVLSQETDSFTLRFLFVGADGNIARMAVSSESVWTQHDPQLPGRTASSRNAVAG
ncbi:hypothetical protein ACMG4H_13200 [Corynebacterium glutamicum]|uniref:Aspartate/ornithine carbamoyltransferase carbamoyl-P binding domain-containing protein n=2 Tax=Corynebacterium glutamicum TaxID=1718 RepID=A0AB36I8Y4_CORGT|nr:hypothetical protein [Corynebacterium glutamicum]NII87748.1 ornithine carbamoyltransferase [Corynebacterium glutamicum]OKX78714.1 hypothetical protein AUP70_08030 [Corynebacterium glutamicum]OKX83087.1 hypothetical protein AUP69_04775 [Corynebacterium glutamicum]BAF54096.1 hypothetical protein cgR_1119 [Corynebacterium glutamicum R]